MGEYIVDCKEVDFAGAGMVVLPYCTAPHVHEQIVRCKDCRYFEIGCELMLPDHDPNGYCHRGKRRDDGQC